MKLIKNNSKILLLCIFSTLLISGCAQNKSMYYWGSYESLIYSMYVEAGTAEPDVQIEKLNKDIQRTVERGGKTPPGVYAHLGFMYAVAGNSELAKDAFNQEKALFPESAHFIDGMMSRAFKENKS